MTAKTKLQIENYVMLLKIELSEEMCIKLGKINKTNHFSKLWLPISEIVRYFPIRTEIYYLPLFNSFILSDNVTLAI